VQAVVTAVTKQTPAHDDTPPVDGKRLGFQP